MNSTSYPITTTGLMVHNVRQDGISGVGKTMMAPWQAVGNTIKAPFSNGNDAGPILPTGQFIHDIKNGKGFGDAAWQFVTAPHRAVVNTFREIGGNSGSKPSQSLVLNG